MDADELKNCKLVLIVEDTFAITGRGLVVTGTLLNDFTFKATATLKRPDGSLLHSRVSPEISCSNSDAPFAVGLPDVSKDQVPIGTEIWAKEPSD